MCRAKEMDAWAVRSHQRAIAGIDNGSFEEEIAPIEVKGADGSTATFAVDEHPRRGTTVEKLAELAVLHPEIEGFSITAGNSSGLNDGGRGNGHHRRLHGRIRRTAAVGNHPRLGVRGRGSRTHGLGTHRRHPEGARSGRRLRLDEIDLWEINEAFASMCVATCKVLDIDDERVNVLGSGCSLGHPIAMTGARMVITLAHELQRRGGGTGVAAMCAGGGMSTAVVLDVPG